MKKQFLVGGSFNLQWHLLIFDNDQETLPLVYGHFGEENEEHKSNQTLN
jgi:hypothetical protein